MPRSNRRLKPDYILRVMRKEMLTGLEVVFLTGEQFGVSVQDGSLRNDDGWVDVDAPDRYHRDLQNYRGWGVSGRLYCAKCWTVIEGVPKDIVTANWCDQCAAPLYSSADEKHLDFLGFCIYRDRVTRYTQIAAQCFASLIVGSEELHPNGGVTTGFHKDHIYSVRDAFENDIAEVVVSAPSNLRIIQGKENGSKGRRSGYTLEQLLANYEQFLSENDRWLTLIQKSDEKQETFICSDDDSHRVRVKR